MTVGEAIKIVRTRRRLRQRELAQRSGVSQSLVSHIENGRRQPTTDLVERFCEVMEVPPQLVFLMGCNLNPEMGEYREPLSRLAITMLELLEAVGKKD